MRENCPEIPIPHLWAFGFPGGQSVCRWVMFIGNVSGKLTKNSYSLLRPENMTTRMIWYIKRYISRLFGYTLSCEYIINQRQSVLEHEYLIMDYTDAPGIQMLSKTWNQHSDNAGKKKKSKLHEGLVTYYSLSQPASCAVHKFLDIGSKWRLATF